MKKKRRYKKPAPRGGCNGRDLKRATAALEKLGIIPGRLY
jgi:hypothetical protein